MYCVTVLNTVEVVYSVLVLLLVTREVCQEVVYWVTVLNIVFVLKVEKH